MLIALSLEVALELSSSSFLRQDVAQFQAQLFLFGRFFLVAFRFFVAFPSLGELSVDLSLDGCLQIYQFLEVSIIGGLSNQVIQQQLAAFILLQIKKYLVPFSCILLCQFLIDQRLLEVALKIIKILSVKRKLQKLFPEEATLSIVFFEQVSEQFDVVDDIEVIVFFLFFLVFDGCKAELDCLFVVAASLLDGLFEVVKRAFLCRNFWFGFCLGFERSCQLFYCFFEVLELIQSHLISSCFFSQDTSARGLEYLLCLKILGRGCLFDGRNHFFRGFFDLKMGDGSLTGEMPQNLFHILIFSLLDQVIHYLLSILNASFSLGHYKTHICCNKTYFLMLFVASDAQAMQESLEEHICVVELTVLDQQHERQFARNVSQQLKQLQFDQFCGELVLLDVFLQSKALQVRLVAYFFCVNRRVNLVLLVLSDDNGGSQLRVMQFIEFPAGKQIDHH